ncbi:unnamed protein product, partial [Rotaria sp. Silwood1]
GSYSASCSSSSRCCSGGCCGRCCSGDCCSGGCCGRCCSGGCCGRCCDGGCCGRCCCCFGKRKYVRNVWCATLGDENYNYCDQE